MKRGILLIGHGSRTGKSREIILDMARLMQEKSGILTQPCFLEFDRPTVSEGLALLAETADLISAVPMFLAPGTHTEKTIPELLGIPEGKKETVIYRKDQTAVSLTYADPICAEPALADILLRKAESSFPS